MLPAVVLALATLVALPIFPDESASRRQMEPPLPVHVSFDATPGERAASPEMAGILGRLADRTPEYLRTRGLQPSAVDSAGFLVSPAPNRGGSTEATAEPSIRGALELSVGLNSSSIAAASGAETRFGGEGDNAWRLAYQVQRNVVGGMRDVLGYDIYDRGIHELETSVRQSGAVALRNEGPWVVSLPLFASNWFESALLESSGAVDVLAASLANAIADYFDPTVRTPRRAAQVGWSRLAPLGPIEPRTIYQAEGSPRLALTFDGGASSEPTPAILGALRDAGVRATMFMTADFVERNPDLVVQMARDGHEFGNHSATHPDMTTISDEEIVSELERLESAVVALTGKSTRPWFRPPFGAIDDRVLRVAASQGYWAVMWTADSADWRSDIEASIVESRMLRYSEPGAIMIEHLGSPQSAQVLPDVLRALAERGFCTGTLSEVIGTP